ncbi:unnamed protein product [Thlaspi arvense]|uniref:Uncharacterized protein n=1 Tax=Thlaspi arvense TaxID=13288 RepID=A0AAU9RD06_THLAR|nr:unnamed protein product [Thlaspi arvense]
MENNKVTSKESAEAKDIFKRFYHKGANKVSEILSHARDIQFRKELEDLGDESMRFCDTAIYRVVMQVLIVGTLVPLHVLLQKKNDYFFLVRFIMGMYGFLLLVDIVTSVTFWLTEIGSLNERVGAKIMASISHFVGIAAIILHLRLISPVLAMCLVIPVPLWISITLLYRCFTAYFRDFLADY